MSTKPWILITALLAFGVGSPASSQQVGPKNGSLVIVGGGQIGPEIYQRFIQLAGGPQAPILYIPTASGRAEYGPAYQGLVSAGFTKEGATNFRLLHTNDRAEADSEEFVQAIREAGGVFFGGGRQWRLADIYLGTKTEAALWELLERGGVIGGSSAGATIQGSYLARGDTKGNLIMMGDHEEGFAFLKNVAIDQHLLRRNRQFDLVEIVRAKPELLGIGLDEGAAIVVRGDEFEVLGGYAVIYDAQVMGERGYFYFLSPGDRFHLARRAAMQARESVEELWLPQIQEEIDVAPTVLRQYVGTYEASRFTLIVTLEGQELFLDGEGFERRALTPWAEDSFFDSADGERLSFVRNDDGEVRKMIVGAGEITLRRIE